MEDAHFAVDHLPGYDWSDTAAFGVMDGHGGREVALFCQMFLPGHIAAGPVDDPKAALIAAFEAMDELLDQSDSIELLQTLVDPGRRQDPRKPKDASFVGCTAVVVLVRPDELIVGNAGDSRAVLCRRGKAVPLSEDHKPNNPGERSRIIKAGGVLHMEVYGDMVQYRINGNLNLSRAIGDLVYKRNQKLTPKQQMICSTPDVRTCPREVDDEFVILACDGVWDRLSSQEAVDFVSKRLPEYQANGLPLSGIMEELVSSCCSPDLRLTGGLGGDNMTAVLVMLNQTFEKSKGTCEADNVISDKMPREESSGLPVLGTLYPLVENLWPLSFESNVNK